MNHPRFCLWLCHTILLAFTINRIYRHKTYVSSWLLTRSPWKAELLFWSLFWPVNCKNVFSDLPTYKINKIASFQRGYVGSCINRLALDASWWQHSNNVKCVLVFKMLGSFSIMGLRQFHLPNKLWYEQYFLFHLIWQEHFSLRFWFVRSSCKPLVANIWLQTRISGRVAAKCRGKGEGFKSQIL